MLCAASLQVNTDDFFWKELVVAAVDTKVLELGLRQARWEIEVVQCLKPNTATFSRTTGVTLCHQQIAPANKFKSPILTVMEHQKHFLVPPGLYH